MIERKYDIPDLDFEQAVGRRSTVTSSDFSPDPANVPQTHDAALDALRRAEFALPDTETTEE